MKPLRCFLGLVIAATSLFASSECAAGDPVDDTLAKVASVPSNQPMSITGLTENGSVSLRRKYNGTDEEIGTFPRDRLVDFLQRAVPRGLSRYEVGGRETRLFFRRPSPGPIAFTSGHKLVFPDRLWESMRVVHADVPQGPIDHLILIVHEPHWSVYGQYQLVNGLETLLRVNARLKPLFLVEGNYSNATKEVSIDSLLTRLQANGDVAPQVFALLRDYVIDGPTAYRLLHPTQQITERPIDDPDLLKGSPVALRHGDDIVQILKPRNEAMAKNVIAQVSLFHPDIAFVFVGNAHTKGLLPLLNQAVIVIEAREPLYQDGDAIRRYQKRVDNPREYLDGLLGGRKMDVALAPEEIESGGKIGLRGLEQHHVWSEGLPSKLPFEPEVNRRCSSALAKIPLLEGAVIGVGKPPEKFNKCFASFKLDRPTTTTKLTITDEVGAHWTDGRLAFLSRALHDPPKKPSNDLLREVTFYDPDPGNGHWFFTIFDVEDNEVYFHEWDEKMDVAAVLAASLQHQRDPKGLRIDWEAVRPRLVIVKETDNG
jgi:hypothetical protein